MKIQTFNLNGTMRSGVYFVNRMRSGRCLIFFWSPRANDSFEIFATWSPSNQNWDLVPLSKLPAKKRSQLQQFWNDRARTKANEVKARMAKVKPAPEPA